ncbi:hypothetical protein PORCRE_1809 [Porphyromonas crevioricanis JCM 15906]|uniref:ATPase involved in DNA repair n=1 Tax=Porphyromonas crevioricanis JCM 15906 TaxID=1305617 RepID=T1CQG0_9PORP|nr:DUF349 domain-containing protein [Porphyromonas crevioricanis]GAD06087.1 hypothetical protein PORCRE_1809 [Porphyromonas crevioricanis JCM 15906]SJZ80456.1 protein of unknown function [Porphyromonas crevioricanis]
METPTNSQQELQQAGSDQEKKSLQPTSAIADTTSLNDKNAAELVEALAVLLQAEELPARTDVEAYKKAFYRRKQQVLEAPQSQDEEGGESLQDLSEKIEVHEERLKDLLASFRERYQKVKEEEEAVKAQNLEKKQDLLTKLGELLSSTDEFGKIVADFRQIRESWDALGAIPEQQVNEIQNSYNKLVEQFYDLKQINDEFREYDFRKNLEAKTTLCEEAESLSELEDIVQAARKLQDLHKQWRDLGPVARDLRESIWVRFKAASSVINKKHQEYFDQLKAAENDNLEHKDTLCQKVEGIKIDELTTPKQWEQATQQVLQIQAEWKSIGFAPKKENEKIYLRFRGACDAFFSAKSMFFSKVRKEYEENYARKKEMAEEAESLQDSEDWKGTTARLTELQAKWKEIGPVHRRQSDAIWHRFRTACDKFFNRKKEANAESGASWAENLKLKLDIIAQLEALEEEQDEQIARDKLAELTAKFRSVGFVPFKDKEKVQKAYRVITDKLYDRLRVSRNNRRLEGYGSTLDEMGEGNKGKLFNERTRMLRILDRMKQELQTYSNNLGFLSTDSKGGNALLNEMNRKKERLEEDIRLMQQKIKMIDERIDQTDE